MTISSGKHRVDVLRPSLKAIFLLFWVLTISACSSKQAEEGDRDLVLTIEQLTPYGLSLPADFRSHESLKRTRWFDGSTYIEYEFEAPEALGLPYLSSSAERHPTKSGACESYLAGNIGVKIGIGGVELDVRDDLFEFGDRSRFGLLVVDGHPTGNYFGMCHDRIAFSVFLGGFYFDDGELWEELLTPTLDALEEME